MPRSNEFPARVVALDVFSVIPGLVVQFLGTDCVVVSNERDSDTEIATITLNTPEGEIQLRRSWAHGEVLIIVGTAVNGDPDTIQLFG